LERSEPQALFRGVRRHEIMAGARGALSASASGHRDLEASSFCLGGAFDVSCVNADDELSLGVIGQIKLDLCAVVRVWRTEPGAISRPFIEPFAEIEHAMANREGGFRRLNRQKFR